MSARRLGPGLSVLRAVELWIGPITPSQVILISQNLGIFRGDHDPHQLLVFIEIEEPIASFGLEPKRCQLFRSAFNAHLLASLVLHRYGGCGVLVRNQDSKLGRSQVALERTALRTATGCKVSPSQNLAVGEEVVVQNDSGMR